MISKRTMIFNAYFYKEIPYELIALVFLTLLLGFTPYSFQKATLRFTFLACDKGDVKENFDIQCVLQKRLRELLYCNYLTIFCYFCYQNLTVTCLLFKENVMYAYKFRNAF